MSARPGRKAQISMLRAENAALRELLDMRDTVQADDRIELHAVDEVRDRLAVAALIVHHLDVIAALRFLGYPVDAMDPDERQATSVRIFDRDRVRDMLREAFEPVEVAREAIVASQIKVALFAGPEQSTKSFGMLAKLGNWFPSAPAPDPRRRGIRFLEAVRDVDPRGE